MFNHEHITTNHNEIRKWVEEHGGIPACTKDNVALSENRGILRIMFSGEKNKEELIELKWSEFFNLFDQAHLAFLYEDNIADGIKSNFYKFISCDGE